MQDYLQEKELQDKKINVTMILDIFDLKGVFFLINKYGKIIPINKWN